MPRFYMSHHKLNPNKAVSHKLNPDQGQALWAFFSPDPTIESQAPTVLNSTYKDWHPPCILYDAKVFLKNSRLVFNGHATIITFGEGK